MGREGNGREGEEPRQLLRADRRKTALGPLRCAHSKKVCADRLRVGRSRSAVAQQSSGFALFPAAAQRRALRTDSLFSVSF